MSVIFDSVSYPFHDPTAQQLQNNLVQLFPTVKAAVTVAERAEIDTTMIFLEQPVFHVWQEILVAAATAGLVREVVVEADKLTNKKSSLKPFLETLLSDKIPPVEAQPTASDGSPDFINSSDEITEPEALLYYDDLTIQTGRLEGFIKTLQILLTLVPSVCKLNVDINGLTQYGTAFRIDTDLLLTNWHVIHDSNGVRATNVTAEFSYEDDGRGGIRNSTLVSCDVTNIISDRPDDWGVIRVAEPLDAAIPIIKLSDAVAPVVSSAAYIVQHPGGARKRLGFVRNQISFFDERVVHYLTDTQNGSSGAPVFNSEGKLIALHHAAGRPQEILGRIPIKKNEGIRISRVIQGLIRNEVGVKESEKKPGK